MGIIKLYKIMDAGDEENYFYLVVRTYIDDIMCQFSAGLLDREQLLDILSKNDIPYDIIYPEDYEEVYG